MYNYFTYWIPLNGRWCLEHDRTPQKYFNRDITFYVYSPQMGAVVGLVNTPEGWANRELQKAHRTLEEALERISNDEEERLSAKFMQRLL